MENAADKFDAARRVARHWVIGATNALFPPRCLVCGEDVSDPKGLCAECWRETRLSSGSVCDGCGRPMDLALQSIGDVRCEDCVTRGFCWRHGRAAALYEGGARSMVLALKHGDRPDLAPTMAGWMARAGRDILHRSDMIIPVPLHWTRLVKRRLNQSAELSRAIARLSDKRHAPGLLMRTRATESQRGRSFSERKSNVAGAFGLSASAKAQIKGQRVTLVDDVMTTGATLNTAGAALLEGGAKAVDVLVFATVYRGDVSQDSEIIF